MISTRSKIQNLIQSAPGAQDFLDGLVHDAASQFASNTNNEGLKAQLEFMNGHGRSDEEVLAMIEEAVRP